MTNRLDWEKANRRDVVVTHGAEPAWVAIAAELPPARTRKQTQNLKERKEGTDQRSKMEDKLLLGTSHRDRGQVLRRRTRRPSRTKKRTPRLSVYRGRGHLGVKCLGVPRVETWHVVCWEMEDKRIASTRVIGRNLRLRITGLDEFHAPFTVGVTGFSAGGEVLFQDGRDEIQLRQ